MVLLGIRTAWRVELDASPAELTFGTALHLPGEFVESSGKNFIESDFLANLQKQMNELAPVQTSNHATQRRERVPASIDSADFVFVRRDARAPPLTRPYTGPFRVITRHEKYFEIEMNGKKDSVSIDRLKPAFIENKDSAVVCYGPRVQEQTESSPSCTTQPLVVKNKRGRPSRAVLEQRRHLADTAKRESLARREQDQDRQTRFGRVVRPPDRF